MSLQPALRKHGPLRVDGWDDSFEQHDVAARNGTLFHRGRKLRCELTTRFDTQVFALADDPVASVLAPHAATATRP